VTKLFKLTLGVVTAIGGFVDVGNLVTSGITGARFGVSLVWAVLVGTIGMTVYGEMAGRVSAAGGRAIFHAVRERLGVRTALANVATSGLLSLLTLAAEIGGVALVLQLATGLNYLIWVPLVGLTAWLVIWRLPFSWLENVFGLLGIALVVFVVALFNLPTDWHGMWHQATHPWVPAGEGHPTYFFYAVSLIGACMVPYQISFGRCWSSGMTSSASSGPTSISDGAGLSSHRSQRRSHDADRRARLVVRVAHLRRHARDIGDPAAAAPTRRLRRSRHPPAQWRLLGG
jgi:manganese transport protein